MKKLLILAMLLVLPITLAGCAKNDSADSSGDESFSGTLQELIDGGKSMKCTYNIDSEGATGEGVVYVDGQKSYTEMVIENEGESMTNYMISDSEWIYSWNTMMPGQGTKMNLEKLEEMADDLQEEDDATTAEYQKNFEEQFDYKCSSWNADSSKFTPPSDVEFTDWTDTLEQLTGMATDLQDSMQDFCGTCNMLSGQEKTDCLQNLGCE